MICWLSAFGSTLANAGGPIITCTQDTLSLNASSPAIGTGLWTTSSSAVIINPTQANSIVTNLQQDTTYLLSTYGFAEYFDPRKTLNENAACGKTSVSSSAVRTARSSSALMTLR